MIGYPVLVIIIRLLIVFIGFLLFWKAISISRKSRENKSAYWFLSIGFLIFTMTQILEGILFEFTNLDIDWIHITEGVLTSISFLLIIVAITRFREPINSSHF